MGCRHTTHCILAAEIAAVTVVVEDVGARMAAATAEPWAVVPLVVEPLGAELMVEALTVRADAMVDPKAGVMVG